HPVVDALTVDVALRGLRPRIVMPDDLHKTAVARDARVGHDDAEERPLLRAHLSHANHHHSSSSNLKPETFPYRIFPIIEPNFARAFQSGFPLDIPPTIFSILRICTNCFNSRFTSSTVVPLPRAMRLRRLPSI